jgi:hypothetical protein
MSKRSVPFSRGRRCGSQSSYRDPSDVDGSCMHLLSISPPVFCSRIHNKNQSMWHTLWCSAAMQLVHVKDTLPGYLFVKKLGQLHRPPHIEVNSDQEKLRDTWAHVLTTMPGQWRAGTPSATFASMMTVPPQMSIQTKCCYPPSHLYALGMINRPRMIMAVLDMHIQPSD